MAILVPAVVVVTAIGALKTWGPRRSDLEYFKDGAAAGEPYSMMAYGNYYEHAGNDPILAREWNKKAAIAFEKAALAGNAHAMGELSMIYAFGHGVPQDTAKANYWKVKAWMTDPSMRL